MGWTTKQERRCSRTRPSQSGTYFSVLRWRCSRTTGRVRHGRRKSIPGAERTLPWDTGSAVGVLADWYAPLGASRGRAKAQAGSTPATSTALTSRRSGTSFRHAPGGVELPVEQAGRSGTGVTLVRRGECVGPPRTAMPLAHSLVRDLRANSVPAARSIRRNVSGATWPSIQR